MYERLRELKFYGLGCECEELFGLTCQLAYKLYGLGESEKAEIVFGWAKEQAEASYRWVVEEGESLDEFITGM